MAQAFEFGSPLPPLALDGERHRLRPFHADDAHVVAEASKDESIPKITTVPRTFTSGAGVAFIDRQNSRMTDGEGWSLAIATIDADRAVGQVGLWISSLSKGRAEIGYWVAPSHRRRGAASDGVSMMTDRAFENLDVERLSLFIEPWNDGSIRTAERVGFTRETLLERWERVDGRSRDMVSFVRFRS